MQTSEDTFEDWIEEARNLRDSGELEKAKERLNQILEKRSRYTPALREMGDVLMKEGDYDKAVLCYKKILEIKSDDTYVLNELGIVYCRQGNLAKAIELFNRVLEKNPSDNYVLSELGLIYARRGDAQKASHYLEEIARHSRGLFADQFDAQPALGKAGEFSKRDKDFIVSGRITTANAVATCFAHQINNPLQIILNSTDRVQKKIHVGDVVPEEDLQKIRGAAGRIHNLIQHLYKLIKHESRDYEYIIVNRIILNAFGLFEQQLRSRKITVNLDEIQEPSNAAVVYGNSVEFEQVFINLIANARDALTSKADGAITVRMIQSNKDEIRIDFCDNGAGISKDDLERVFDSLFTTKPDGTGLGLWLCLSVINQMNGTLKLESDLGKGTRCIIRLPRQAR